MPQQQQKNICLIGQGALLLQCAKYLLEQEGIVISLLKPTDDQILFAKKHNLKILESLEKLIISKQDIDFLFSINNPEYLPDNVINLSNITAINYHNSILPAYAGMNASSWAILNGENIHGVTWHHMTEKIDGGDIILQKAIPINANETASSLNLKCYQLAYNMFRQIVSLIRSNISLPRQSQKIGNFKVYRSFDKPYLAGMLDFNQSAEKLSSLVRALDFSDIDNPIAIPKFIGRGKVWGVKNIEILPYQSNKKPGTIIQIDNKQLVISSNTKDVKISGVFCLLSEEDSVEKYFYVGEIIDFNRHDKDCIDPLTIYYPYEKFWIAQLNRYKSYDLPRFFSEGVMEIFTFSWPDVFRQLSNHYNKPIEHIALVVWAVYFFRILQEDHTTFGLISNNHQAGFMQQLSDILPLVSSLTLDLTVKEAVASILKELHQIQNRGSFLTDLIYRYQALARFRHKSHLNIPIHISFDLPKQSKIGTSLPVPEHIDCPPLTLYLGKEGISIQGKQVKILMEHFIHLAEILCDEKTALGKLDIIPFRETTFGYPIDNIALPNQQGYFALHHPFLNKAKESPHNIALIVEGKQLTYQDLLNASIGFAIHLKKTYAPLARLAVKVSSGWKRVAIALACSMSRMTFVPISMHEASQRELSIIKHCALENVIDDNYPDYFFQPLINIDNNAFLSLISDESFNDDLAYIIHTSGSTGNPKGVAITHTSALNTILDINNKFGFDSLSVLAVSDFAFDLSIYDIFGVLAQGGTIVFPDSNRALSPKHWLECIEKFNISIWNSAPALMEIFWRFLQETNSRFPQSLQHIMLSGDYISLSLAKYICSECKQVNLYSLGGATEASIWSIYYPINEVLPHWRSIPYGKPLSNQFFYILDENLQRLPLGVEGELYIGGTGLAEGYYNDIEKTNKKFIIHPKTKERLYKTGDKGYFEIDGNIIFCGRIDRQVKIDGVRVELGEIERCLAKLSHVINAVVTTEVDERGRIYIVGFVHVLQEFSLSHEEIQLHLKCHLPRSVFPRQIQALTDFPINENGKIDRKNLHLNSGKTIYSYTNTQNKRVGIDSHSGNPQFVSILSKVLNYPECEIDLNKTFQAMGGTSLDALNVIANLEHNNLQIPFEAFFQRISLNELSQTIVPSDINKIKEPMAGNQYHLKPSQVGILSACHNAQWNKLYLLNLNLSFYGDINILKLNNALKILLYRYPYLKAKFCDETMTFSIDEKLHILCKEVDLSGLNSDKQLIEIFAYQKTEIIDYAHPPLLKITLFKLASQYYYLLLSVHHALLDGLGCVHFIEALFTMHAFSEIISINSYSYENKCFSTILNSTDNLIKSQQYWQKLYAGFTPYKNKNWLYAYLKKCAPRTISKQYIFSVHDLRFPPLAYVACAKALAILLKNTDISLGVAFSRVHVTDKIGYNLNVLPMRFNTMKSDGDLILDSISQLNYFYQISPGSLSDVHTYLKLTQEEYLFPLLVSVDNFSKGLYHLQPDIPGFKLKQISIQGYTQYPLVVTFTIGQKDSVALRIDYCEASFSESLTKEFAQALIENLSLLKKEVESAVYEI